MGKIGYILNVQRIEGAELRKDLETKTKGNFT